MLQRYLPLLLGTVALGATAIGTNEAAYAVPLSAGVFTGEITSITSTNFANPGFTFNEGDSISGNFTFNPAAESATFTASITDSTTGSSFTIPAVGGGPDTASATSSTFSVSANNSLEFQQGSTPFTTAFLLNLTGGTLIAGDLTQGAPFAAGTGSFTINVPAEGITEFNQTGNPDETLTIDFNVSSANIPEPASLTVLGSGMLALGAALRRRRRSGTAN
jgi:PEP-CTERM motif